MGLNRLAKWQKITGILVVLLIISAIAYGPLIYEPVPQIPVAVQAELVSYLESNRQSPLEYVTGKFDDHDVVFLGEHHRAVAIQCHRRFRHSRCLLHVIWNPISLLTLLVWTTG